MVSNDSFRLFEPSSSALLALKQRISRQSDWISYEDDARLNVARDASSDAVVSEQAVQAAPSQHQQAKQPRRRVHANQARGFLSPYTEPLQPPHPRSVPGEAKKAGVVGNPSLQQGPDGVQHAADKTDAARNSEEDVIAHNTIAHNRSGADFLQDKSMSPTRANPVQFTQADTIHDETAANTEIGSPAVIEKSLDGVAEGESLPVPQTKYASRVPIHEVDAPRIPSVVTFGGQPVALEGDLVYLGGGLYAAAAPPKQSKPLPRKVLPGRIQPGPRAHVSRTRTVTPLRSLEGVPPSKDEPDWPNAKCENPPQFARAWRPAGASKLPHPPPSQRPFNADRVCAVSNHALEGGAHSEVRAKERSDVRKEGGGIFGPGGLLRELERMREGSSHQSSSVGAPLNMQTRVAERRAARQARSEKILAERAERIEIEAMCRGRRACSTPSLRAHPPIEPSQKNLDRQKLKVACKLELIDFFNSYASSISKLNQEETKSLLQKLNGFNIGRSSSAAHRMKGGRQSLEHVAQQNIGACSTNDEAFDPFSQWPDDMEPTVDENPSMQSKHVCDLDVQSTLLAELSL